MDSNKKIWMTLGGLALVAFHHRVQVFVRTPYKTMKIAEIPAGEYDPAVWGQHYPLEYKSYLRNKEMAPSPTGFGGSVKFQKSVKEPEILINFKGMPFSVDYTGGPRATPMPSRTSGRRNASTSHRGRLHDLQDGH